MVDVSTAINTPIRQIENECREALCEFICAANAGPYVPGSERLAERLILLDRLDVMIGDLDLVALTTCEDSQSISLARAIRTWLETANERAFESARSDIALRGNARMLRRWLLGPAIDGETRSPHPGLGFDLRDEIVTGVLQLREPNEAELPRSPEMVPYQPTPARHILDLIAASKLSDDDVLVDLESGMGHVPLLVSILTGNRTIGVEFQPAYVASARESARNLNLRRTQFVAEDARVADLSSGTVFYLFSPFTGSILDDVLERLRIEATDRKLRICSLGPCTRALEGQGWVKSREQSNIGRIAVFQSQ